MTYAIVSVFYIKPYLNSEFSKKMWFQADTFKPSEVPLASILAKIKSSEGTAAPESLSEEVPDYDIGELITAWKAFVREKAEKEKADEAVEDYYVDEPPQPPPRRAVGFKCSLKLTFGNSGMLPQWT